MENICAVCSMPLGTPIFESKKTKSMTTMNKLIDGRTTVFFCEVCQHGQTTELQDLATYYATEYEISIDGEDDDQLYDVEDGKQIYRSEHQARVLKSKINLSLHCNVLDYGCAKALTLGSLCKDNPNIRPFLFDVTEKYVGFWKNFPTKANWATHKLNPSWLGKMDVVLSFYALEHIPNLTDILSEMRSLLKVGGYLYFIVPDMYQNPADFIVADHVNHFSRKSLWKLLAENGFTDIEIDAASHTSAYIISARRAAPDSILTAQPELEDRKSEALELASFWDGITSRINQLEAKIPKELPLVIYGAGIYGHFIYSCLNEPDRVTHFLDQSSFLQGTEIQGCPVLYPHDLPYDEVAILVGLNPLNARRIIADVEGLSGPGRTFLFLS